MPDNPYTDVPGLPAVGPIDVGELLGRSGPRELEIGFGRARFLLDRAAANPGTSLLGIETRRKWVHRAAERAARRELGNVTVRHADARHALPRMEPDGCFARVFVSFPDPWWKARHQKRLLLDAATAAEISRLLADRGELFVQTDVDFRAQAYRAFLSAVAGLEPAGQGGIIDENHFGARSSREIRCQELGLPIFRLLYQRRPR